MANTKGKENTADYEGVFLFIFFFLVVFNALGYPLEHFCKPLQSSGISQNCFDFQSVCYDSFNGSSLAYVFPCNVTVRKRI